MNISDIEIGKMYIIDFKICVTPPRRLVHKLINKRFYFGKCVAISTLCIEFLEDIYGCHSGNDRGIDGRCWYLSDRQIVSEVPNEYINNLNIELIKQLIMLEEL